MNVFGIDYGRTASVIVLREGGTVIRSVGDGLRNVIPHAAKAGGGSAPPLWGSHALLAPVPELTGASAKRAVPVMPSQRQSDRFLTETLPSIPISSLAFDGLLPGSWTDEPEAALFWIGLQDRLYRYLGRMAATEPNGYRVVVALSSGDAQASSVRISRFAHSAGLQDIEVIRATDALVSRFIVSPEGTALASETDTLTVAAIVVGDVVTDVCACRLVPQMVTNGPAILRPERHDSADTSLPYGQAHWMSRLIAEVHQQLHEPLLPGQELLLQDAAREFGAALGRAAAARRPDDTLVYWLGPFRDCMYSPFKLRTQDCLANWPEAGRLSEELPTRIREAAQAVGAASGVPDILLLGGSGAGWPFAIRAVQQLVDVGDPERCLIWLSDTPEEDVARGASWWPEVEDGSLSALRNEPSSAGAASGMSAPKAELSRTATASRKAVTPKALVNTPAAPEAGDTPEAAALLPPSLRQLDF